MSKNERKAKIYTEDTIRRLRDNVLGVVIRTWHDIEQGEDLVTLDQGEFEVNWLDTFGAFGQRALADHDIEILHEDDSGYVVVDRSFGIGDAVKKDSTSAMSGIVQRGKTQIEIRNFATREVQTCLGTDVSVESERYQVGDYVVKDEWIGIIKSIRRRALLRLASGEYAICDEEEMHPVQYEEGNIFYPDMLPCTTLVEVSKTGLRNAQYMRGSFHKGISRQGAVCISFTWKVTIDWQFQNMMVPKFTARPAPERDYLPTKDSSLRRAELIDAQYTQQIGDFVRPLSGPLANVNVMSQLDKFLIEDAEERRHGCMDWEVTSTQQEVMVKWQDGTTESILAIHLVPYQNVDDLELWASDHVVSKNNGQKGIVQTCNAQDRTATVLWNSSRDNIQNGPQLESLYELMNDADFNVDLGDLVLIVPEDGQVSQVQEDASWGASALFKSVSSAISRYLPSSSITTQSSTTSTSNDNIDWFGQLIAVGTDGSCIVSLCYNQAPRQITVPLTRLVHVASTGYDEDNAADSASDDGSDLSMDSTDSEFSIFTDFSVEDKQEEAGVWTNEDGRPVSDAEDGNDWEDESENDNDDDDNDDEMAEAMSDDDEMIDIIDEQITEPERADIVLDAVEPNIPLATNTTDNSQQQDAPVVVSDRSTEVAEAALPVTVQADSFPQSATHLAPFLVLDSEPSDHAFTHEPLNRSTEAMKRVVQEYKSLRSSLPSGILVRAYESRMDLLRVIILGVPGTPYVYAPMLFDVYLPSEFPHQPPFVHFHSWTNGIGKINPNLYEEGKVCLSLLGTWHGSSSESWTTRSSLLQIFVSLQALVLVREPYYNEAGYEVLSASDTAVAANNYSERAFVLTRGFIVHVLRNPVLGLEDEMEWLYRGPGQFLHLALSQAEAVVSASMNEAEPAPDSASSVTRVSKGALVLLRRTITNLHALDTSPNEMEASI